MVPYLAAGWLLCALLGAVVGSAKRATITGGLLGLILGPVGLIAAFAADGRFCCPECHGRVDGWPRLCPHCRSTLPDRPNREIGRQAVRLVVLVAVIAAILGLAGWAASRYIAEINQSVSAATKEKPVPAAPRAAPPIVRPVARSGPMFKEWLPPEIENRPAREAIKPAEPTEAEFAAEALRLKALEVEEAEQERQQREAEASEKKAGQQVGVAAIERRKAAQEERASKNLQLAKRLLADPKTTAGGRKRLELILRDFPGTKAAQEAAATLRGIADREAWGKPGLGVPAKKPR